MPKRVIDFYDSVQFTGEWSFVKEKKERIKVKAEKAANSEIYMIFNDIVPLYAFLYFALAPEEAFEFQKVQPILDKMKGDDEESKKEFEECKRALTLNWDGVTPLTDLIREHKKHIIRDQKAIYNISSRITEEEVKQLLKSGLSQRKIHLDYHTNDGSQEEAIIPTVQNILNCVTIIYEEKIQKYLLAFFSHIPERQQQKAEQKKAEQKKAEESRPEEEHKTDNETHNTPHTFKDRPLPQGPVPNPDDRPLPPPEGGLPRDRVAPTANQRQPNFERTILNPDEKYLSPPEDQVLGTSGAQRSNPRNVANPDDRLLPLPPKEDKKDARVSSSGLGSSATSSRVPASTATRTAEPSKESKATQLKNEVVHLGHVAGDKIYHAGEKVVELGRKAEGKVEGAVDEIIHDRHGWVHLGVAAGIILLAIKVLRD